MKVKPQVNGAPLNKKVKSNIKGPNSPDGIQNKGISKKKQKALLKKGNKANIKLLTGNDGATKGNTSVTDITLNKFPAATKKDGQLKKKNKKKKSKAVKQLEKEPTLVEEEESDVPESPTFGINDTITNSENESSAGKKNKRNKKKNKQQKLEQNHSNKTEESSDGEDYEENTTIFVGNLPKTVEKVEIQNFFKKYGKVKKIRLRSVAQSDQRIPKKVAAIKKDFHKDADSVNAFVTFEERFEARDALITNGSIFNGHHIRVNYAVSGKEHNNKVAIFVGNLPFAVRDDELWEAFENCGQIESVRVIRDKNTRIGKGFGYVNFKSPDGVELALQMEDVRIQHRKLRIARAADPKTGHQKNQEKIMKKRKRSSSLNEVSPDKTAKKKKLTQEVSQNESDETQESEKKKFQGEKSAERRLKKQSLKKKIKKMRNEKHKKSVASLLTSNSRKDFAEKKKNKKT